MRRPREIDLACVFDGLRNHIGAARPRRVPLSVALVLGVALLAAPVPGSAQTSSARTYVDFSLYGLGAAMSGDVAVGNASADLNVGFSDVLDHLEFGVMGFGRVGRDPWSATAEVVYMGLGASKDLVSSNFDQWVVETRVAYRVSPRFEPFLGVRYNNLSGEIAGPLGRDPSGTQDWVDPFAGATATVPLGRTIRLVGHGDVGGLGIGSDLTWQIHPYLDWSFLPTASLQAGYRWLDVDYETGSGADTFRWDVLTQGPQLGVTVRLAP